MKKLIRFFFVSGIVALFVGASMFATVAYLFSYGANLNGLAYRFAEFSLYFGSNSWLAE